MSKRELLYRNRASVRLKGSSPARRNWKGRSVRLLKASRVSGSLSWLIEIRAWDDWEKEGPRASKAAISWSPCLRN